MPVQTEYYLICSNCGETAKFDDGEDYVVFRAESEEELVEQAEEELGWMIDHRMKLHVCPSCQLKMATE